MSTDTSRDELLPCPFCGSENINTENARDFISCRGCGTEGPCRLGQGSTSAIEAWNRRSSDRASIRAQALEEAAKVCDDGWHLLTRHECAEAIRALKATTQGEA